jgi:prepilin-type processing-associated H-X9-DG protein
MNIFASNYDTLKSDATTYVRGDRFNPFSAKMAQRYILFAEANAIFADAIYPGKFGARYIIGQEGSSIYRKFMKATEDGTTAGGRGPFSGYINFNRHDKRANFLLADQHVETLAQKQVVREDPNNAGKWISSLRVWWSPEDEKWNQPTPP